jgi:hypothetical protein
MALMAQHGMWRELMHDSIEFVALQERLAQVDTAERQATQVYARSATLRAHFCLTVPVPLQG